jgi:hypothetical protein
MTNEKAQTPPPHIQERTESAKEMAEREFVSALRRLARPFVPRHEACPVISPLAPSLSFRLISRA